MRAVLMSDSKLLQLSDVTSGTLVLVWAAVRVRRNGECAGAAELGWVDSTAGKWVKRQVLFGQSPGGAAALSIGF
jgi:hypothetical protein